MISGWVKEYKSGVENLCESKQIDRQSYLCYYNNELTSNIRAIRLYSSACSSRKENIIVFDSAPLAFDKIKEIATSHFEVSEGYLEPRFIFNKHLGFNKGIPPIHIRLTSAVIPKVKKFLEALNTLYHEIPSEILQESISFAEALCSDDVAQQSEILNSIAKSATIQTYMSPDQESLEEMDQLLLYSDHVQFPMAKFEKLLTWGINPNQKMVYRVKDKDYVFYAEDHYLSYIYHVSIYDHKSVQAMVRLLLCYGGNPFDRVKGRYSLHDIALQFNDVDTLNLIIAAGSKVERPITNKVKDITIASPNDKHILTKFYLENGEVLTTTLMNVNDIKPEEKKQLSRIFKQTFCTKDPAKNIEDVFEDEISASSLSHKMKLCELITFNDYIAGCNIFERIYKKDSNGDEYQVVHWAFSMLDPAYNGFGMIPLLGFRIGFCEQLLYPKRYTAYLAMIIHKVGYSFFEKLIPCWPKHQSDDMEKLVSGWAADVYEDEPYTVTHKTISYYTESDNEIQVIESKEPSRKPKAMDLEQLFFDYHLKGKVTTAFFTDRHAFEKMQPTFLKRGVDFGDHILKLAPFVNKFLNENKGQVPSFFSLPDRTAKFWGRQEHPQHSKMSSPKNKK